MSDFKIINTATRIGNTDINTWRAIPAPKNTDPERLGTWCVVAGEYEEADVWIEVTAEHPQDVAEFIVQAVRNEHERRCPSCDHRVDLHQPDGCWYTVTTGAADRDLVCPCVVPIAAPTEETDG